jgi:LEA14-like dessication related protein
VTVGMGSRLRVTCLFAALLAASCSRPSPPTLTAQRADVTSIGTAGISLLVQMAAYNPNRFGLSAKSVTADVTLDAKYKLGTVTILKAIDLPAKTWTRIDAPLSIAWTDMAGLITLAASGRTVPYAVDGTVSIGGDVIRAELPFHLAGQIAPEQFAAAVIVSLPKVPGLR